MFAQCFLFRLKKIPFKKENFWQKMNLMMIDDREKF